MKGEVTLPASAVYAVSDEGPCGLLVLPLGLDQVMFHRVAGSSSARGDLDFAVDRGQVSIHGTWTDDELFSDLCIGQSLGYQTQHFDFAGGEPIGIAG